MYNIKGSKPPAIAEPKTELDLEKQSADPEDSLENSYYAIPDEKEGSYLSKQLKTNYFIDHTEILSKTDDIDISAKSIDICIYKVCTYDIAPYLLYLLEYNGSAYTWVQSTSQDDESTTLSQKIVAQYPFLTDDEDVSIGTIDDVRYKGFYEREDSILTVYDTTTFKKDLLHENDEFLWVSPYEILCLQKVYDIPIDPSVISFFKTMYENFHYDFYHLKKEGTEDEYIPTPYVLYLCQTGSNVGTYENVGKLGENAHILYPRVDHEKLDRFFLFSSNLLHSGSHEENLKILRFAVFMDLDPSISILYIDGPDAENQSDLDHLYDGTLETDYSIVTFLENGQQYWSVKNPEFFSQIE